jgi:lysophospholipase L1-like esterase
MAMKRAQIICLGSSSLYGVGGAHGSWADLLKRDLHKQQYEEGGAGQVHEVYSLGVPGFTIEKFLERAEADLVWIRKPSRRLITVIQLGGNNTMAVDEPENYVTSPEEFKELVRKILEVTKKYSDEVLWVGMNLMDESKVMPIVKDLEKNRKVYFPNKRKIAFDRIAREVCAEHKIKHITLIEKQQKLDWVAKYQYEDGIHPNDDGYRWMYEQIKPFIPELLS